MTLERLIKKKMSEKVEHLIAHEFDLDGMISDSIANNIDEDDVKDKAMETIARKIEDLDLDEMVEEVVDENLEEDIIWENVRSFIEDEVEHADYGDLIEEAIDNVEVD